MNNQEAYERAKKRVETKVGFCRHLTIYIAVCVLLIIINFSTATEYLWFIWPLMGWGVGLFIHALSVFGFGPRFSADWEERKIKETMDQV